MSVKQFISKRKKNIIITVAVLFGIAAVVFVALCSRIQITPDRFYNTYWESEDSVLSIYVPEAPTEYAPAAKVEGKLQLEDGSRRIYLDWVGGSQKCAIFDADKRDSNLYYFDEYMLIEGYGHWNLQGQYVIKIDKDNAGLNTDRIVLVKQ